jgi:hypothetical protein
LLSKFSFFLFLPYHLFTLKFTNYGFVQTYKYKPETSKVVNSRWGLLFLCTDNNMAYHSNFLCV